MTSSTAGSRDCAVIEAGTFNSEAVSGDMGAALPFGTAKNMRVGVLKVTEQLESDSRRRCIQAAYGSSQASVDSRRGRGPLGSRVVYASDAACSARWSRLAIERANGALRHEVS